MKFTTQSGKEFELVKIDIDPPTKSRELAANWKIELKEDIVIEMKPITEILPCPVCGKLPKEHVYYSGYVIECDEDCDNGETPLPYVKDPGVAVENWNNFVRKNNMNIEKLKLILKDRHKILVLDDMQGPVDINGGYVISARSLPYDADTTEEQLAIKLSVLGKMFAFYKLDHSVSENKPCIRFFTGELK